MTPFGIGISAVVVTPLLLLALCREAIRHRDLRPRHAACAVLAALLLAEESTRRMPR